ncbi:helix-turn-helix domain-containing protein [Taklimakanibacter deserti]|uniref:helix-turn-helix domain-containing protein n=1 Tax=Taklimakanibacter deserti TaxID=2267839 RepID=UPI0013C45712
MNPLERYFATSDDTPSRLAERIDRAPSTITRLVKGQRRPSFDLAEDIERGTGRKVLAAKLMAAFAGIS